MKFLLSIFISLFVFSCVNNTNFKIKSNDKKQKDSLASIIYTLNSDLKNKNILTEDGYKKAITLINTYKVYISLYDNESIIEKYLFDLIMYQQGINLINEALKSMDTFVTKFPESDRTPEIINMQAAIYDIEFHDVVLAKKKYQSLINSFPNHPLAIKAKEILENGDLDLTIEERVHQWQKNIK